MWGMRLANTLYGAPIRAMYVTNTYMGQLLYMVQVCEEYLYATRIWDMYLANTLYRTIKRYMCVCEKYLYGTRM